MNQKYNLKPLYVYSQQPKYMFDGIWMQLTFMPIFFRDILVIFLLRCFDH